MWLMTRNIVCSLCEQKNVLYTDCELRSNGFSLSIFFNMYLLVNVLTLMDLVFFKTGLKWFLGTILSISADSHVGGYGQTDACPEETHCLELGLMKHVSETQISWKQFCFICVNTKLSKS